MLALIDVFVVGNEHAKSVDADFFPPINNNDDNDDADGISHIAHQPMAELSLGETAALVLATDERQSQADQQDELSSDDSDNYFGEPDDSNASDTDLKSSVFETFMSSHKTQSDSFLSFNRLVRSLLLFVLLSYSAVLQVQQKTTLALPFLIILFRPL